LLIGAQSLIWLLSTGATCGFFPVDSLTIDYLKMTGKDENHLKVVEEYSKACGFFRDDTQDIIYTDSLSLDMANVEACLSGPKRPQDRVLLSDVKNVSEKEIKKLKKSPESDGLINDGNILIAAYYKLYKYIKSKCNFRGRLASKKSNRKRT
jgi:aconitase A